MSKLLFLILSIVAVASVATGVVEVQLHPDKLSSAPGDLTRFVSNGVLLEKARSVGISAKRAVELYSAQEENQKLEVAVGFVREDATRLEEMVEDKPNIEKLVPQTEMLAKSIKRSRELAQDVSEGDLAELRVISEEAFGYAGSAFGKLAAFQKELQTSSDTLTKILEDVVPPEEEGEVAGAQDEAEDESEETAPVQSEEAAEEPLPLNTSIPLRF